METRWKIREAIIPADVSIIHDLFQEYQQSIGMAEFFPGFQKELAELPGKYSHPTRAIFIAQLDLKPVGCIALRPLDQTTGELKRLYIRPEARGKEIGRLLLNNILEWAKNQGIEEWFWTHYLIEVAIQLYRSLGFPEIPAYITSENSDQLLYLNLIFNSYAD